MHSYTLDLFGPFKGKIPLHPSHFVTQPYIAASHTVPYCTVPYLFSSTVPVRGAPGASTVPYRTSTVLHHTVPVPVSYRTVPYQRSTVPYRTIPYRTSTVPCQTVPYCTIPYRTSRTVLYRYLPAYRTVPAMPYTILYCSGCTLQPAIHCGYQAAKHRWSTAMRVPVCGSDRKYFRCSEQLWWRVQPPRVGVGLLTSPSSGPVPGKENIARHGNIESMDGCAHQALMSIISMPCIDTW